MEEEIVKRNAEVASRKASDDRKYGAAALDFEKSGLIHISSEHVIQQETMKTAIKFYIENNAYSQCSVCR